MRRNVLRFFVVFAGILISTLAFGQEDGGSSGVGLWAVGSGLAMGLAALGGTIGQGQAASGALSGLSRNPTSADKVFTPMIIALALIEFQAIMGFIIAFMWLNK